MSCCRSGTRRCTCHLVAGPGIELDGQGSSQLPWVVTATPPETGCGLEGAGTAGDPLVAAVGTWPYACPIDDHAGGVFCDSAGVLRSEPRPVSDATQTSVTETVANLPVPTTLTVVATRTITYTNPSPCQPSRVIIESEVDVDFTLPPGAMGAYSVAGDEMWRITNTGTITMPNAHGQGTKVTGTTVIPPGATATFSLDIALIGSGGATYNRVQSHLRATLFAL